MLSFTLDTNCIIDVEEQRPSAPSVRALVEAHSDGRADVALVAVSASERQRGDLYLENYDEFISRVNQVGLGHLRVLLPMLYWDVGFWNVGVYSSKEMTALERSIHKSLFPSIPFDWAEFAEGAGMALDAIKAIGRNPWRNAFCDRQMFWSHVYRSRDVFVTRDSNFQRKLSRSALFSQERILNPHEAVALISNRSD